MRNASVITEILLLGFQSLHHLKYLLFTVFLVMYWLTLCGNFMIIILVSFSKSLQTPMYIFLTQLSAYDILITTDIVPNLLYVVLNEGGTISLSGCMTQYFFFVSSEGSECFLLTLMSYDRYLAICNPLRYNTLMSYIFCFKTIIMCWILGFFGVFIEGINLFRLWFCGPHVINHFFCDLYPLLDLSCSDTSVVLVESILISIPVLTFPFLVIIISYVYIVITILKIQSLLGRQKAFSTCSSHLAVVCIFFGSLTSIYLFPYNAKSGSLRKLLSLLYTVVTPLINPLIYSFRNKDIKEAFNKLCHSVKWEDFILIMK